MTSRAIGQSLGFQHHQHGAAPDLVAGRAPDLGDDPVARGARARVPSSSPRARSGRALRDLCAGRGRRRAQRARASARPHASSRAALGFVAAARIGKQQFVDRRRREEPITSIPAVSGSQRPTRPRIAQFEWAGQADDGLTVAPLAPDVRSAAAAGQRDRAVEACRISRRSSASPTLTKPTPVRGPPQKPPAGAARRGSTDPAPPARAKARWSLSAGCEGRSSAARSRSIRPVSNRPAAKAVVRQPAPQESGRWSPCRRHAVSRSAVAQPRQRRRRASGP